MMYKLLLRVDFKISANSCGTLFGHRFLYNMVSGQCKPIYRCDL